MNTLPRVITAVLLLAALFIGLAHIALLPPFEGFDETGHYSYIQQLADTGRSPRRCHASTPWRSRPYPGAW
jgi:hypothetical protein